MTNNKKFWEELIAYFPWYDTGHIENDASNNSSIKKSIIFWDRTPCSPLSYNRRFGGTYRLFRNVGGNSMDYTASYPRRWYSS
jgi:hypothetical protein